jgi:hypothetical protein
MSEGAKNSVAKVESAVPELSAVDQLIAQHEGDPRAAVAALLEANNHLEDENRRLAAIASAGYIRRALINALGAERK